MFDFKSRNYATLCTVEYSLMSATRCKKNKRAFALKIHVTLRIVGGRKEVTLKETFLSPLIRSLQPLDYIWTSSKINIKVRLRKSIQPVIDTRGTVRDFLSELFELEPSVPKRTTNGTQWDEGDRSSWRNTNNSTDDSWLRIRATNTLGRCLQRIRNFRPQSFGVLFDKKNNRVEKFPALFLLVLDFVLVTYKNRETNHWVTMGRIRRKMSKIATDTRNLTINKSPVP